MEINKIANLYQISYPRLSMENGHKNTLLNHPKVKNNGWDKGKIDVFFRENQVIFDRLENLLGQPLNIKCFAGINHEAFPDEEMICFIQEKEFHFYFGTTKPSLETLKATQQNLCLSLGEFLVLAKGAPLDLNDLINGTENQYLSNLHFTAGKTFRNLSFMAPKYLSNPIFYAIENHSKSKLFETAALYCPSIAIYKIFDLLAEELIDQENIFSSLNMFLDNVSRYRKTEETIEISKLLAQLSILSLQAHTRNFDDPVNLLRNSIIKTIIASDILNCKTLELGKDEQPIQLPILLWEKWLDQAIKLHDAFLECYLNFYNGIQIKKQI